MKQRFLLQASYRLADSTMTLKEKESTYSVASHAYTEIFGTQKSFRCVRVLPCPNFSLQRIHIF